MDIFVPGWSEFWDPYIRLCGIIQLWILISNIFFLYRYFYNQVFVRKKVKEIENIPSGDKEIRSLIEKKFDNNVKYYIISRICSRLLLNDLNINKNKTLSHIIKISKNPESIIERQMTYKNYLILSIGVFSLFIFVLFIIIISIFNFPYLLANIDLKDYDAYLAGPFQLFVLTSINFFISIWTFIQFQKFAKSLSLKIQELEIFITQP
jgi:hypothetical protein